jgi:hypothetical protein
MDVEFHGCFSGKYKELERLILAGLEAQVNVVFHLVDCPWHQKRAPPFHSGNNQLWA